MVELASNLSHVHQQHQTIGAILRIRPRKRSLLGIKAKFIEEIQGMRFFCKNSTTVCTQSLVPRKPVCEVYYDCPSWPCSLSPDCSVETELNVDCIVWHCEDTRKEKTTVLAWIGIVCSGISSTALFALGIVFFCRANRSVIEPEPRARGTVNESCACLVQLKRACFFLYDYLCCCYVEAVNGKKDEIDEAAEVHVDEENGSLIPAIDQTNPSQHNTAFYQIEV